jgi:SMI1-KNR4 cell-wall
VATPRNFREADLEHLIRPLTQDWNSGKNPAADIGRWEKDNSVKLPADYRNFMLKYNGGRVYPLIFKYAIPMDFYPSDDGTTFVDPLYDWAYVEKIFNGDEFGEGLPDKVISIGSNPGDLEILLSLDEKIHGQIFCWLHSDIPWGEEGNDKIWLQAPSFSAFMKSLFENSDNAGYEPGLKHLQRELRV